MYNNDIFIIIHNHTYFIFSKYADHLAMFIILLVIILTLQYSYTMAPISMPRGFFLYLVYAYISKIRSSFL